MRYLLASAIGVALVTSAAAQTATTCQTLGNSTYCTTTGQTHGPTLHEMLEAIPHPRSQSFSASDFRAMMERHRQMEKDSLRKTLGQMVVAGQCSDARATALNAGDFELAQQVDSMCRSSR